MPHPRRGFDGTMQWLRHASLPRPAAGRLRANQDYDCARAPQSDCDQSKSDCHSHRSRSMSLVKLGWNGRWQKMLEAQHSTGLEPARVVGEHRSHYRAATETVE